MIDRYKKKMEELGIRIRPNTVIGSAIVIDNLFRDGYSSVFVGTGVWRPKAIGIKGESLGNVYFGIDYLRRPEAHQLGEKVAVIGMGNVAMDVAELHCVMVQKRLHCMQEENAFPQALMRCLIQNWRAQTLCLERQ